MGIGDQLIATGLAKGAAARGKKIAFGNGINLIWDHNSEPIFRGNPNIAFPGQEHGKNVEWIHYYKGHRIYNQATATFWVWNLKWKCIPGEIYLTDEELKRGDRAGQGFIILEPNIENWKSSAANKDWGIANYQAVVMSLLNDGYEVIQFMYPKCGPILRGVRHVPTHDFRDALSIMRNARMYLGAEGGLHHGAAAVGIPAVVLFGGFIPPSVTGYDTHTNLVGSDSFCGSFDRCKHCIKAMANISQDTVYKSAKEYLNG